MAYIGRDIQYGTFEKQVITPPDSSTTVYTLDQGVADANNLLLSIGGVIQEPNVAFTAVGTVLTFTSAPAQGSSIWIVFLGNETTTSTGRGNSGSAITYQTGLGNGTVQPITLSKSVLNSKGIVVTLNGLVQTPETNYTASGTTLTFDSAPSTEMNILVYYLTELTPISAITAGSITAAKLASSGTMPAWNGSALTNLTTGNLTGTLPALDGSSLTGLDDHIINTSTNSGPLPTSNKNLGWLWMDTSTGELYCCTDATPNLNVWTNVGMGSGNIIPNQAPTAPTNTTSYTWSENNSHQITFTGGTDAEDGTPSHYVVDNILPADGKLTVNTNEVSAGSVHTFVTGNVAANTNYTFRVRSKDSGGAGGVKYSPGVTITVTVTDTPLAAATGGDVEGFDGDYKYHVFNNSGTFTISLSAANFDYLVVAGGGGGGAGWGGGGGGGAGGYLAGTNVSLSNGSYTVTVGGPGSAASQSNAGTNGASSTLSGSGIFANPAGGGGGASGGRWNPNQTAGKNGGSGGGGGSYDQTAGDGGNGTTGQGNDGGNGDKVNSMGGGGGGGASAAGADWVTVSGGSTHQAGGFGGVGTQNLIAGTGHGENGYYAGGGAGGNYDYYNTGTPATGGNGGGGNGGDNTPGPYGVTGTPGDINTGGGGGGGSYDGGASPGSAGGKGVVIIRYRYQ